MCSFYFKFFIFVQISLSLSYGGLAGSEICSMRFHFYFLVLFFKQAVQLI